MIDKIKFNKIAPLEKIFLINWFLFHDRLTIITSNIPFDKRLIKLVNNVAIKKAITE